jgi:hypothetical protein
MLQLNQIDKFTISQILQIKRGVTKLVEKQAKLVSQQPVILSSDQSSKAPMENPTLKFLF